MSLALAFWTTMLIVLLGGGYMFRARPNDGWPWGVAWILILLLGWAVFGPPIHG